LNITHLIIAQLTLKFLLGIMAGRHGERHENAERKSNQEIGNAANPTGNSMDRWLYMEKRAKCKKRNKTPTISQKSSSAIVVLVQSHHGAPFLHSVVSLVGEARHSHEAILGSVENPLCTCQSEGSTFFVSCCH
jgi:hypothetical protein